jgi:hypothetical protein
MNTIGKLQNNHYIYNIKHKHLNVMRFFLVMALALPLRAAEFSSGDEFIYEEDEERNNPTYCSTPPSPPADTTTEIKDKPVIRGATQIFTPGNKVLDLPIKQTPKQVDDKEKQEKSAG